MSLTDSVALFDLGTTVLREQFELIFLEKRRFYQKEAHIWIPAFAGMTAFAACECINLSPYFLELVVN